MTTNIGALIVGVIFALGLGVSGMTQPQKVIGFLDLTGNWDPSLMFVMMGSIMVHFASYRLIKKRASPLFSPQWHLPKKTKITPSLITGSIIFGIGWGLAGYCPGPALTSLASGNWRVVVFVGSMLTGMYFFKLLDQRLKLNR